MRVGDVMTPHPFTVPWNASIVDAREVMSRRRIRHLLVTDDGGLPAGVVTDRDIRSSLPSPATSLSVWEINDRLERLTVGQVMTEALMTIGPDHDAGDRL
ncbi:MAG: CBS domain-containing protein [Rhizorhabdus sp.]|nr:MAG: CBS domain-containing protein [Rhizorhabdus sp.]